MNKLNFRNPKNKQNKIANYYFDFEVSEIDIPLMNHSFKRPRYRTKNIVDNYYDLVASRLLEKSWKSKSKSKTQYK